MDASTRQDQPRSDRSDLLALYAAERADGSAIFTVSMQLMILVVLYGTVAATQLGRETPIVAYAAVPLWGLLCYQLIIVVLTAARVRSIELLEDVLFKDVLRRNKLDRNEIGSKAGDGVSNIAYQPKGFKIISVVAYGTIPAAAIAFSGLCVSSAANRSYSFHAWLAGLIYLVFVVVYLTGWWLHFGKKMTAIASLGRDEADQWSGPDAEELRGGSTKEE